MLKDLEHSLRALRLTPLSSLAAICILAVAIGASAAVFTVVDKVLIRPLPINEPQRVFVIWPRETANPTTVGEISNFIFQRWRQEVRSFQRLAAMGSTNWSLILREGEAATLQIAAVSGDFFPLLGASAGRGRTLRPEDDRLESGRVAVMSHGTWVRRFGSNPGVVGRSLRFESGVYTIVGIMPDGFDYPRGAELWVPLLQELTDSSAEWKVDTVNDSAWGVLFVLGRLNPEVSIEAARSEMSSLVARDARVGFRPGMDAALTRLDEHIFGNTRPALVALGACVGLVLLIGCANVAVLLLVRAAGRANEMATRLAIGATRWRMVRQSLSDAIVLSCLGGVVGLGIAFGMFKMLLALAPQEVPRLGAVRFDAATLAFTGILCLATALLVGIGPGLQSSWRNLTQILNSGGSRVVRSHRVRRAFVVVQVGLAIVLLVCAGLVGRSFLNLLRIDIGFAPSNVLTVDVTIPRATFERHQAFYTQLLARVRALPGVVAAGAVYLRPLEFASIGMDSGYVIEGQQQFVDSEKNPRANLESITPDYFRAIGTSVIRGRSFTDADTLPAPRVAIVSDRLARRLWPGQDPIGKPILPPGQGPDERGQPRWAKVVGVVQDARYRGINDLRYDLYLPQAQIPGMRVKHLMVRTTVDAASVTGSIRAEALRLEATALIENATVMSAFVERATAPWRFSAWTLGLLGLIALTLASFGVFATLSQSVVERTREIGIRVAVGALPRQVSGLVFREGLTLTAVGIALGSAVATLTGGYLGRLLFEVPAIDGATLAGMAMLFSLVSAVAVYVPAWRASRLDPTIALRSQ
ncbi:MAG TPA: ABC transporter permease [Vicinamibacterales bacterium]|nr:ABC transporter permease [Vicinamibacterales bacterium]